MIDLRNIARQLRIPPDQLRLAADLLAQGYQPAFIERYRSDEIGNLPRQVLWPLKLGIEKQLRLNESRKHALQQLHDGVELDSEAKERLELADTEVEIDCTMRAFRARRLMQQNAERESVSGQLLEKLMGYDGAPIDDLNVWVQQQLSCDQATAELHLQNCKKLIANLVAGDSAIAQKLRQAIQRRATLKVKLIADQNKGDGDESAAAKTPAADGSAAEGSSANSAAATGESLDATGEPTTDLPQDFHTDDTGLDDSGEHDDHLDAMHDEDHDEGSDVDDGAEANSENNADATSSEESASDVAPQSESTGDTSESGEANPLSLGKPAAKGSIAKKGKKKKSKEKQASKSMAKVSPRQRRRRWLISMLQPFNGLSKPLSKLSAYQQLMIGRGRRSQLVSAQLEYDLRGLVNIVRDAFVNDRHPLVKWFGAAIEESLSRSVLNKVELEAITELEEAAQQKLFEVATAPLREQLEQRPVRGHRILVIDAVGPKNSSVAIIDAHGRVLHTTEIACSAHPQTVTQNVVRLGELVHRYRVTLVGLTNGPARRFLVHTLKELVNQSAESGLRWTMVDRGGAEAYAASRAALQELPEHNRRDRATIWIARRLQDPLNEMVKLDATRLRLGSYQRELPAEPLKKLINETISDAVCARGIDTLWASVHELMTVPGIERAQADQIVKLVGLGKINSREDILSQVTDWPEHQSRQAIGFLRVFGSANTFDATAIHPDDYKLAERLVQNAGLAQPPAAPKGWVRPQLSTEPAAATSPVAANDIAPEEATEVAAESTPSEPATNSESATTGVEPTGESTPESLAEPVASAPATEPTTESTEAPVTSVAPATDEPSPEYPENITDPSSLDITIDVEKLARGWQVGRGKLRWIAHCLQNPFGDARLTRPPVPLSKTMPTLENLEPGQCLWVVVVGVADFGAFVELGPECSGLIHISRLSSHYVEDPHQCVQVGDLIQAWVISIDPKKRRVAMTAISPELRQAAQEHAQQQRAERADNSDARPRGNRPERGGNLGEGQGQRRQGGQTPAGQGNRGQQTGGGGRGRGEGQQAGSRGGQSQQGGGQRGGQQRGDRRGGQGGGQRGGGRGRESQPIIVTSKKPKEPITPAMKEGTEPLRSFSDLLQFYEMKRTDPPAEVPPPTAEREVTEQIPPEAAE